MGSPLIEVRNLRFAFGRREVIAGLSWDVEAGHFHGVVGPNGCGKTTLLMLLMGYYRPKSGEIRLMGEEVDRIPRQILATRLALVPQDFTVNFDFSVHDVVMMGRYPYLPRFAAPSRAEEERVAAIMEEMEVDGMADRSVMALSGGEKQRVVFARALAQDTPLLLLDEATSNMDIRHTLHCLDRVARRVMDGGTVIGVFHDLNLAAMYCDRLIFMSEGRIVERGETEKVFREGIIEKTFGVEGKVVDHPFAAGKQVLFKKEVSR